MSSSSTTFVKTDPAPLEAAGLRWLAAAGARVPSIVSESPERLVLQRIEQGDDWNAYYLEHRLLPLARRVGLGSVPARTLSSYADVRPLADGWQERVGLWQLFPLLVHAVLFGGGYLRQSHDLALRLA